MNLLKRISFVLLIGIFVLSFSGCGNSVGGSLEKIMSKLYDGIKEDELPKMLTNIEITDKNIKNYLGIDDIQYKSALASEVAIGSTAHSVVLVRLKNAKDVEEIKGKIMENINPKKWFFVGVDKDDIVIESKGNLIMVLLIENESTRNKIKDAFNEL